MLAGTVTCAPTTRETKIRRKFSTPAAAATTTESTSKGCATANRAASATTPQVATDSKLETSTSTDVSLSDSVGSFSDDSSSAHVTSQSLSESPITEAGGQQDTADGRRQSDVTLEPSELLTTFGDIVCPDTAAEHTTTATDTFTLLFNPTSTKKQTATEKAETPTKKGRSIPK